jgi:pimeloyl-ACP methyl ester carboxylesterase
MMSICDIGTAKLAYQCTGEGDVTFVMDAALGSCSAEWRHIARKLVSHGRVLIYDRAGYGQSTRSSLERTPRNIAEELKKLLDSLKINTNLVMVGHSQGGLYAVQFALAYPGSICGLILLDPATPFDDEFKKALTKEEYKQSGVDKTGSLKAARCITAAGFGFTLRPLLEKGIPFYYHEFDPEAKEYLLRNLCRSNTYRTALEEYFFSHSNADTKEIADAVSQGSLGSMKIKLLTHSSQIYTEELMQYGGMKREIAEKVESLWQGIMSKYLHLSKECEHISAGKSGHYIHLTDEQLLLDTAARLSGD